MGPSIVMPGSPYERHQILNQNFMTRICGNKDDKSVPTGSRAACCLVQKTVQVCNLDNSQLNTHCLKFVQYLHTVLHSLIVE